MSSTLGALLAGVRDAPWASAALSELRAVVADLADALAASLGAHADADACEAVVAALWQRAEQGAGWTEPFWRECYVLACVATAVALSSAPSGNHQLAALRHLDLAFIMGGPPECLLPFVAEVEPLVPRAGSIDARLLPRSLPEGDTPVLRAGLGLCRLESHEWARFRKEFFNVDAPVVLAGLGAAWPALDKWRDLEGFWNTQFGHRFVPLEVGKHTDGGWREEVVPMRDFLADLATGTRCLYLAQHPLFDHLTSLRADFEVPDCVGRRLTRINAWLGSSGTVTPLHYDSYDGLLTQAVGYKYVRLYPASNTPFLYRTTASWALQRRWPDAAAEEAAPADDASRQGTISLVDVENPDLERFPLFQQARFMETVLGPGDALFIPAGCWHFVKSLSVSASISFVF